MQIIYEYTVLKLWVQEGANNISDLKRDLGSASNKEEDLKLLLAHIKKKKKNSIPIPSMEILSKYCTFSILADNPFALFGNLLFIANLKICSKNRFRGTCQNTGEQACNFIPACHE